MSNVNCQPRATCRDLFLINKNINVLRSRFLIIIFMIIIFMKLKNCNEKKNIHKHYNLLIIYVMILKYVVIKY